MEDRFATLQLLKDRIQFRRGDEFWFARRRRAHDEEIVTARLLAGMAKFVYSPKSSMVEFSKECSACLRLKPVLPLAKKLSSTKSCSRRSQRLSARALLIPTQ